MMWPEVVLAKQEHRHELVLNSKEIHDRVVSEGVDEEIFNLEKLNFLQISQAQLIKLPDALGNLRNLTSLVLKNNELTEIPSTLGRLVKLKLLDLSSNKISQLPSIGCLTDLLSINLSLNEFCGEFHVEGLEKCSKLSRIELTANSLTNLGNLQDSKMDHLSEVIANKNQLNSLSSNILTNWPLMKHLDLSQNCLKEVPAELGDMNKLKELSIVDNPFSDNRLRKMCEQKGTKSVLDYIKSNSGKRTGEKGKGKKKKGKETQDEINELNDCLRILSLKEELPHIISEESVKEVRPYIVFCFVVGIDLSGEIFKKFLSLQTRLHKTVCENRTLATIATHDLEKVKGPLRYLCKAPSELLIVPLSSPHPTAADTLVTQLKTEAEALRKEKKRSAITGLHQYLHLLESWSMYPCLMDEDTAISFPPVTNSGTTRISESTNSLLVEVTSTTKLGDAKKVLDTLLVEMTQLLGNMSVVQGRVVSSGGELKVTYPAKTDLVGIKNLNVIRE